MHNYKGNEGRELIYSLQTEYFLYFFTQKPTNKAMRCSIKAWLPGYKFDSIKVPLTEHRMPSVAIMPLITPITSGCNASIQILRNLPSL